MHALLQFTLDLFGTETAPTPTTARSGPTPPAPAKPHTPVAPVASAPALPLADALSPARFVHPQANREIRLAGAHIAYEFARGKRRTIGFLVGADGLTVRAPRWVAQRDVDTALQEKAAWILRKLGETQQRQARRDATRIDWQDGARFPFLGETVAVRLDPHHRFAGVGGAVLDGEAASGERTLALALAHNATPAQVRDAAQAWLMRQARRIFIERLDHFAPQLEVRWRKLSLSSADTRWGSASADGGIRLHWRLVHFRMPVIDYVVAHELSHLRVMDHSPRFWDTVESVVPDYALLREQLKEEVIPRW